MPSRSSTAALLPETDDRDADKATTEDPVLRSVLTAPVRPGQPPAWEADVLEQAAAGPWVDGASVSAEIAARARRGR
jgi:hypothetical protein